MAEPYNPLKVADPIGPLCIVKGCESKARTRGLCDGCYRIAVGVIKKYKLTWDKLVKHGKALDVQRKPSKKVAWFIDWIKPRGRRPKGKK